MTGSRNNVLPITEAQAFRLANVSRRKGKSLLAALKINPVGKVANANIYEPSIVGQLLAAVNDTPKQ